MNTATGAPGRPISAIYNSRETAHEALVSLHAHHFRKVWSGVTSHAMKDGGGETIAIQSPGAFSLRSQKLVVALVEHGIHAETARDIEAIISTGEAIVVVDPGARDALEAAQLLQAAGGELSEVAIAVNRAERFLETADDDTVVYVEEIFYLTIVG